MREAIKNHPATFAMLFALAMVLMTLAALSTEGMKADGPVLLGLVSAVGVIAGGIVGKQASTPPSPGTTVASVTTVPPVAALAQPVPAPVEPLAKSGIERDN